MNVKHSEVYQMEYTYLSIWDQHYTVCSKDGRLACRLPFPEQYPAPSPRTRYHCQAHFFTVAGDYCNRSGDIARPTPTSAFIHRKLL